MARPRCWLGGCGHRDQLPVTARAVGCTMLLLRGHHGYCGLQSSIGHRVGKSPVEESPPEAIGPGKLKWHLEVDV